MQSSKQSLPTSRKRSFSDMVRLSAATSSAAADKVDRQKQAAPSQKRAKYTTVYEEVVEERKKLKQYVIIEDELRPSGYEFVPSGSPLLTEQCKEFSRKADLDVMEAKVKGRRGFFFDASIVKKAKTQLGMDNRKTRPAKEFDARRRISQINLDTQALETIEELYPRMPYDDRRTMVQRAFNLSNGSTVGCQLDMPIKQRIHLAVIAHIRHTYTEYDSILKRRTWSSNHQRNEARQKIEEEILSRVLSWRPPEDSNGETEAVLREFIVIEDEEPTMTPNPRATPVPKLQAATVSKPGAAMSPELQSTTLSGGQSATALGTQTITGAPGAEVVTESDEYASEDEELLELRRQLFGDRIQEPLKKPRKGKTKAAEPEEPVQEPVRRTYYSNFNKIPEYELYEGDVKPAGPHTFSYPFPPNRNTFAGPSSSGHSNNMTYMGPSHDTRRFGRSSYPGNVDAVHAATSTPAEGGMSQFEYEYRTITADPADRPTGPSPVAIDLQKFLIMESKIKPVQKASQDQEGRQRPQQSVSPLRPALPSQAEYLEHRRAFYPPAIQSQLSHIRTKAEAMATSCSPPEFSARMATANYGPTMPARISTTNFAHTMPTAMPTASFGPVRSTPVSANQFGPTMPTAMPARHYAPPVPNAGPHFAPPIPAADSRFGPPVPSNHAQGYSGGAPPPPGTYRLPPNVRGYPGPSQ